MLSPQKGADQVIWSKKNHMVVGPARWFSWLRAGISAGSSVAHSTDFFYLEGRADQHCWMSI